MNVQRIAKAVLGTAITWGLVWSLLSIPSLIAMPWGSPLIDRSDIVWACLQSWMRAFGQGALFGAAFALLLLAVSSRVRSFDRLSGVVAGALGALGAVGVCALMLGSAFSLVNALIVAAVGASSAITSVVIARRAPYAALPPQTN